MAALAALSASSASAGGSHPITGIPEASGVARVEDRLLIAGDHEPGTYYSLPLSDDALENARTAGRIHLNPDRLKRHVLAAGPYAIDLEAIDVLADDRIVVVSERLSALLDDDGIVANYGGQIAELGGRGLEGVSVRRLPDGGSRVAVLWEGGYPDTVRVPPALREIVCARSLLPLIVVHDIAPGASNVMLEGSEDVKATALRVPRPPGEEPYAQRFRAPDLVWHELHQVDDEPVWGFIVLLSSGYSAKPKPGTKEECPKSAKGKPLRWCYKWLQRFTLGGEPYGEPHDLEGDFPEPLRHVNWEGMSWFERGASLVFVYDESLDDKALDPQEAFVMRLPEGW
jgi:hypothetical protein